MNNNSAISDKIKLKKNKHERCFIIGYWYKTAKLDICTLRFIHVVGHVLDMSKMSQSAAS
jgi:hypothetical protein